MSDSLRILLKIIIIIIIEKGMKVEEISREFLGSWIFRLNLKFSNLIEGV